ncbi:MAG: phage tail protein [Hafnia sp.]
MSDYYILITDAGAALEASAHAAETTVKLAKFGVCDGGVDFIPDPAATTFANEVFQSDISSLTVSADDATVMVAQCIIPGTSGGYTIRGIAIYTDDGTLYATGSYPAQTKPAPDSGFAASLEILAQLAVSDTAYVSLTVTEGNFLTETQGNTLYLRQDKRLSEIAAAGAEAQSAARDNLALGTAATATLTTSTTDNTVGHVLKVGDRGLGVTMLPILEGFDFATWPFAAGETLLISVASSVNKPAGIVSPSGWVYIHTTGIRNVYGDASIITTDFNTAETTFCACVTDTAGGARAWVTIKLPTSAPDIGAMPLYPTPLTVDLNTLGASSSAGVYCQQADVNATTELNYPVHQSGTLLVTPSAYGCQQEYTTFGSGQKFTRGLAANFDGSGPWQTWVPQYSPGNPPPATDLSGYVTSAAAYSTFLQGVRMANYGSYGSGGIYDSAHKLLTGIYATNGWDNPSTQEARTPQFNINGSWYDMAYV